MFGRNTTPEQDRVILETPLQVWIMSIKKALDDAKSVDQVIEALFGGIGVVMRKDELERSIGSKPLETAKRVSIHEDIF